MTLNRITQLADTLRQVAYPLTGKSTDYDSLIEQIGNARFVLIGEASHGTHEFYRERGEITKRLIREKGFNAVAVEADWPDAYRVNRYVRGAGEDAKSIDALGNFQRFPTWMWRNTDVLNFIDWLRAYNDSLIQSAAKVSFYGLDLYSLYNSIEAVLNYLDRIDPEAAKRARYRYSCFDRFDRDTRSYGYTTSHNLNESCEKEVVNQLVELQRRSNEYARRDGRIPENEFFYAEQNARLVKNAEEYYRTMFRGRVDSWNLRARHMAETLDRLVAHFQQRREYLKVVVWEHNSHLGDARATDMGAAGKLNVGQLVRQRYDRDAFSIGLTTYQGTVTAASDWGADAERKRVRPALPESYEALFHSTGLPKFMLNLRESPTVQELRQPRLERAIGVIYRPETERMSHYFQARLSDQFDAVLHFDRTRAIEPLERTSQWEAGEAPDTFPTGM